MKYISTRGHGPVSFTTALLDGLAPDGGLYLPVEYPTFNSATIASFANKSFQEIAEEIIWPFVNEDMDRHELKAMIEKAYASFSHDEITPVRNLKEDLWQLELFHGPTLAFKDVALQLLGQLLAWALNKTGAKATILGATSGDTGPAALSGAAGLSEVNAVILYPHNRTSEVQRRQMTTLAAETANIHAVAIEGTFDDCQRIVKELFGDKALNDAVGLTAVNSISWARLMPQVVYYFYAYSRIKDEVDGDLSFIVPTGNFGDIFAGWVAKQCGLPMRKLVIATNSNDILSRFVNDGDYSMKEVMPTLSPSMDIQVASNFERYLFEICGRDSEKLREILGYIAKNGDMPELSEEQMHTVRHDFAAATSTENETVANMAEAYESYDIRMDSHTATALNAAYKYTALWPVVILSTAHAAKFPQAAQQAFGKIVELPQHMQDLMTKEESFSVLPANAADVRNYLTNKL